MGADMRLSTGDRAVLPTAIRGVLVAAPLHKALVLWSCTGVTQRR